MAITANVRIATTVPLSAAPPNAIAAHGLKAGDQVIQVIDLTTGADNTSFYGSFIPANDLIDQIGTPPFVNTSLVLVQRGN